MGKYFNSAKIVPLVKASAQHVVFTAGDTMFDWASFDIPKGSARLIGATIQCRHNQIASGVGAIDLVFAKDDGTNTTPTAVSTTTNTPFGVGTGFGRTDIVGYLAGSTADMPGAGVLLAAETYQTTSSNPGIVLESNPNSGTNTGYDRYYVAGLAAGANDLRSGVAIGPSAGVDISGSNGTFGVIDGTAPTLVFAPGDILHAEDDIIVGEIASLDANNITFKFSGETSTNHSGTYTVPVDIDAWRIQNGAGAAGDLVEDEVLYNVFPISIILHFER
tara:strand:- start:257 stop:1084 length:828 start_codon:yes stop_codon:yes gene_type:complete